MAEKKKKKHDRYPTFVGIGSRSCAGCGSIIGAGHGTFCSACNSEHDVEPDADDSATV